MQRRSLPLLTVACVGYCLGAYKGYRLGYVRACRDIVKAHTRSLADCARAIGGKA